MSEPQKISEMRGCLRCNRPVFENDGTWVDGTGGDVCEDFLTPGPNGSATSPSWNAPHAPFGLRLVADYQMMGDHDGQTWGDLVFSHAVTFGRILDYKVTGAFTGPFGIELVTFTVDVAMDGTVFNGDMGWDTTKETALDLLNSIVHDTDVDLRWIMPISKGDPMPVFIK